MINKKIFFLLTISLFFLNNNFAYPDEICWRDTTNTLQNLTTVSTEYLRSTCNMPEDERARISAHGGPTSTSANVINYPNQTVIEVNVGWNYISGMMGIVSLHSTCFIYVNPTPCIAPIIDTKISNLKIENTGLDILLPNGDALVKNGYSLSTNNCKLDSCGDPVNVSNGFMWHETKDFELKGRTSLTNLFFKRTYLAHPVSPVKAMGAHWFFNFQTNIFPMSIENKTSLMWTDESGGAYVFLKNDDGSYKNPPGVLGSLIETTEGYELIKSNKQKLNFNKDGRLLSISEVHGEKITLIYDGANLISAETALAGKISFNYDANNFLIKVTRERDNLSYSYTYDSAGNLITATDFSGLKTTYSYGTTGLMLSFTDPVGRTNSFTYDDRERVTSETEPGNVIRFFSYEPGVTKFTEIDGSITKFFFNDSFLVNKIVHADSSITKKKWNDKNLLESTTDELGFSTNYQYDQKGNIISIQRPMDSSPTLISYDQNFNKANSITFTNGVSTNFTIDQTTGDIMQVTKDNLSLTYTLDQFGNILSTNNGMNSYADQTNSNGLKTVLFDARNSQNISYDERGRVITRSFKSGRQISYSYDNYDRIIQIKDSHGPLVNNSYDLLGRLILRNIGGMITKYEWDIRGRLISVVDNLNQKSNYRYNAFLDKPIAIITPDGKITKFKYNLMQRLIEKVDAKNNSTFFDYDLRGDVIKVTDAKGNSTLFSYDGNRRVISESILNVSNKIFTYDERDNLIKKEEGLTNKTITLLTYDSFDRLVKKEIQKGNKKELAEFSYEPIMDANLLKSADNNIVKLGFTNELLPPFKVIGNSVRAADAKNPLELLEGDFSIVRDFSGEIAALKDSKGKDLLSSSYDPAGRLLKISSGNFIGSKKFESVITYDSFGRKTSVSNSDGFKQELAYDQLSRIGSLKWQKLKDDDYNIKEQLAYDLAGNIINSKRENNNTVYGYDEINQLISENSHFVNENFVYDQIGNRTNDKTKITYDLEGFGNMISINKSKFDYNLENKLSMFQSKDLKVNYFYDALGRRVAKKIKNHEDDKSKKSFTQTYLYLTDQDKILLSKNGHGEITEYIDGLGIDEHLGEVTKEKAKSYITDHLGSVLNIEASDGRKAFSAFGDSFKKHDDEKEISKNSNAVIYGFAGRQLDSESMLYYNRARMYTPALGRFLTPDPIGFSGGDENLYRYVENNPLRYVDPYGFSKADVARLQNIFQESVKRMDEAGLRRPGSGELNGMINNVQSLGGKKLPCGGQAVETYLDIINDIIKNGKFDDQWNFEVVNPNPFHQNINGTSSNPSDPVLTIDPWANTFSK